MFTANPSDPDNRAADILYCYQNAYDTADFIPVASVETVEKKITVPVIVGDATAVSCTLSQSQIYVTMQDLTDQKGSAGGIASLGTDGKIPSEQLPAMSFEAPIKDQITKEIPVDVDSLALVDSADSNKTKRLLWSRVKAVLATVFAPLSHTHAWSTITGTPSSFTPSVHAATHKTGGTDVLTASDIGAAASSHNHSASNITSGILSLARGGTGVSSLAELVAALNASGNVQLSVQSYVGTGTYGSGNAKVITTGWRPKLFICAPSSDNGNIAAQRLIVIDGITITTVQNGTYHTYTTVTDTGISWYGADEFNQQNISGTTYVCIAIGVKV